jgi:hypothetical protein
MPADLRCRGRAGESIMKKSIDKHYIIYPSWAKTEYRWEDLPRLLADPLASGYLHKAQDPDYYWRCGYCKTIQPFTLTDGPCGGGIIMWVGGLYADRDRWLPGCVLNNQANMARANGMDLIRKSFDLSVLVMEPHGGGAPIRQRDYRSGASTEHAEAAGESVFWVLCATRTASKIKHLESLPTWARAFGLDVVPLSELPSAVAVESDPWFPNPEHHRIWYEVKGGGHEVGFHFAVLVYLAYHLRWVAGKCVFSMHLVADIEGKPNCRHLWKQ